MKELFEQLTESDCNEIVDKLVALDCTTDKELLNATVKTLIEKIEETHVLVPREPTDEMRKSAYMDDDCFADNIHTRNTAIYKAMINTTPDTGE